MLPIFEHVSDSLHNVLLLLNSTQHLVKPLREGTKALEHWKRALFLQAPQKHENWENAAAHWRKVINLGFWPFQIHPGRDYV